MVLERVRRQAPVIEQIAIASLGDRGGDPLAEVVHPVGRRIAQRIPAEEREIVGSAARRQDQHVLLAQRGERTAQAVMMCRTEIGLDRQLRHRYIGLRIHQHHRHPGAVIQSAHRIARDFEPRFVQQRGDALRQRWRAGRGVTQAVQRLRKPEEVVNRLRALGHTDRRSGSVPVRGQHQHRVRPAHRRPETGQEFARRRRLDDHGRRAVRDEQRGQLIHSAASAIRRPGRVCRYRRARV